MLINKHIYLIFWLFSASMSEKKDALVKRWLSEGLASGAIKNHMNCLCWWAAKVGRRNVNARANDF